MKFKEIILTSFVSAAVAVAAVFAYLNHDSSTVTDNQRASAVVARTGDNVVNAVKKATPAVVAIAISKDVPTYEEYYERMPSPWGVFNFPHLRQNGTTREEVGGGSGFLISDDGYIVTNQHVVGDPEAEYIVFTNDGREYKGEVVYTDEAHDLGVLKIRGNNFPYLSLGDSDELEVGESVIAIGNALAEFRNTVSAGVVSGLARSIEADDLSGTVEDLDDLVQTDAAINPGNSGGPLLNLKGEVIGVNVAIASDAQNIGFALPSNMVKQVLMNLR